MRKNFIKFLAFAVSVFIFVPSLIFAQVGNSGSTINNPLGPGNDSVEAIMLLIMGLVVKIGAIVVVFFIIYSGYKFVEAKGNPGKIEEARKIFFATIIGGAILLGADIIANVVVNTVKDTIKP